MTDFLVRGNLAYIDPEMDQLIQFEQERQFRKLILIPSESSAPAAVREALGSVFQNIYAEGYPDEASRNFTPAQILDYGSQLSYFRRYSDPRYYKGVEYADMVEELARRRCAEVFATEKIGAEKIFVNVQPLSGAPANNAVYQALINPGDTVLGMNLLHGGHLSHGSSVNRSGKLYHIVHYNVDPQTEKIDYPALEALALEHKPKIIIAGYSSYPWAPDWEQYRAIADKVGAYLFADVSHIAGLIAAGVIPSPIGYAHAISFTTHKTLMGPRGAVILTTDTALAKKIDKAVFPGEQGGPHVHAMAGLAVALKIAKSDDFKALQQQILTNMQALLAQLNRRGMRIPFGGSDTHLANLDCKTIRGADGTPLSGDMAARILDIAGIVLNRNTIPGDKTALNASGIRFGTPWMTQRGLKEAEMSQVADIMADVLLAARPYALETRKGGASRAKIDFDVLEDAKKRVRTLALKAGMDADFQAHSYPHYYFVDDEMTGAEKLALAIRGPHARNWVNTVLTGDHEDLLPGKMQATSLWVDQSEINAHLGCLAADNFCLIVDSADYGKAAAWLRDLSDGFIQFDQDLLKKIPGPLVINIVEKIPHFEEIAAEKSAKPYFIGIQPAGTSKTPLPEFTWQDNENAPLRRTPLYEWHKQAGAKIIPFAGWEMPVWYTSVSEEHAATRQAAGLFDVTHMGVYQAEGPDAPVFLDCVCSNEISALAVGESCYTHLLDPHANVLDDLLVYRRSQNAYLVVVNAANDDKDWAWLNAVKDGRVLIELEQPAARAFGRNVILRNLRDPQAGDDQRLDIALQGPKSRDILLSLPVSAEDRKKIMALKRTQLCEAVVAGIDLVVSRTGYTGEKMAFELFVHPDQAVALWQALIEAGAPLGLKPCGLGARDSLRTEAGLPLYRHEMGGDLNLGVAEAGFGSYVKTHKPWFIGRKAYLQRETGRKGEVIRFRFPEKGTRMAHHGDPVLDRKGKVVGVVTSCAIDSDGLLTGQAYIDLKANEEGAMLSIYQGASANSGKPPADLKPGERVILPSSATILTRFPK